MRAYLACILLAIGVLFAAVPALADEATASLSPTYRIQTSLGEIKVQLDAEKAPVTVLNFDQYVRDGFYDGTLFHRAVPRFVIQGGGFTADERIKREGLRDAIRNEWRNGLKNVRGSIAAVHMSRNTDSATSQFLINLKDNPILDEPKNGAGYAVFGMVIEGMEVADQISQLPTAAKAAFGGRERANPVTPFVIESITVLTPLNREAAEARIAIVAEAMETAEKEAREAAQREAMAPVEEFVVAKEAELETTRNVTESGLISLVMNPGTGTLRPTTRNTVTVHYTGTFLDGKEFDSSRRPERGPFQVRMSGGVIDGWLEGLKLMTEGERRLFVIPPHLAYGETGAPGAIPPNSWLVFDVEVLSIQ